MPRDFSVWRDARLGVRFSLSVPRECAVLLWSACRDHPRNLAWQVSSHPKSFNCSTCLRCNPQEKRCKSHVHKRLTKKNHVFKMDKSSRQKAPEPLLESPCWPSPPDNRLPDPTPDPPHNLCTRDIHTQVSSNILRKSKKTSAHDKLRHILCVVCFISSCVICSVIARRISDEVDGWIT